MDRDTAKSIGVTWDSDLLRQFGESDLFWDELLSVEDAGEQMTYDLAVEGTHNYVANDIIVHNTGQFEQDADVILFPVWPHRLDSSKPANEYQIWVLKNRNRPINDPCVNCQFDPGRQRIKERTSVERAKALPNYVNTFDAFNNSDSQPDSDF